jgi:hypothetical protein
MVDLAVRGDRFSRRAHAHSSLTADKVAFEPKSVFQLIPGAFNRIGVRIDPHSIGCRWEPNVNAPAPMISVIIADVTFPFCTYTGACKLQLSTWTRGSWSVHGYSRWQFLHLRLRALTRLTFRLIVQRIKKSYSAILGTSQSDSLSFQAMRWSWNLGKIMFGDTVIDEFSECF